MDWFNRSIEEETQHPLILIGIFIVVFLAIHPFKDGNGRLSRVLTTLLLLRAGYGYVPYSSMESIIERNKDSYYLALRRTQQAIRKEVQNWDPWLAFFLKTMAMTWNVDEIDAMRELARERGLEFKHDGLLNPRIDCGASRNGELQLRPEQVVALDLRDPERARKLREVCAEALQAGAPATPEEYVYGCGAGRNSFTVDPYGRLQMCQLSRRAHFDLREAPFSGGWNGLFPMLRERRWQSNSVCRSCSLISLCGSCPGAAELEHGDVEAMVAHFCEITHLRTHALAGEVPGHRPDATCCLGEGRTAAPEALAASSGGCGSCSHADPAPGSLIQIARKPARPSAV